MDIGRLLRNLLPKNRAGMYNETMNKPWVQVYTAYGQLDASMLVDFLIAHGIEATSIQESLGTTYGLTVGPLGEAKIYVPDDQRSAALDLIKQMEDGELVQPDNTDPLPADSKDQTDRNSD
jgi:hypothetical protein